MASTIKFWGVRGSIPSPGHGTARYGGNTPCISIEGQKSGGKRFLVLDAGTGIRQLGNELVSQANGKLEICLLISHTHWDHIQGLPFFTPFFDEGNSVRIVGPKQGKVTLSRILREQMNQVVFPVPLDGLAAHVEVEHVEPGEFVLGDFEVAAIRLRHPGDTLAYRIKPTSGGPVLAYVTDNELGSGGDYEVGPTWRSDLVRFLQDVDVVIHDAMFTPDQIEAFRGWGHSSYAEALDLVADAGVGRLVLFHHRPEHDDEKMDTLTEEAQAAAARMDGQIEVITAAEGLQLTL